MKKILCVIAAFVLITGCDDGEMGYKTFDFSSQPIPTACPNNSDTDQTTETYYKINTTEGLILKLVKGTLKNTPTGTAAPQEIILGGSNTLTYQNYVSKPTNLCTLASIPAATETWIAEGTLSVTTFDNPVGGTTLEGYTHQVTLKNVTFKRQGSDEKITLSNVLFGNIEYLFDFDFDFTPGTTTEPVVNKCDSGTILYTKQGSETLSLYITDFATYITNAAPGTVNIPIPNTEGEDAAKVLFNVYSSTASDKNVCGQGAEVPSSPVQEWQLLEGTITIVTTGTIGSYSHAIYLKDAVFVSLINTEDTFVLDEVITIEDPKGYYLGTY